MAFSASSFSPRAFSRSSPFSTSVVKRTLKTPIPSRAPATPSAASLKTSLPSRALHSTTRVMASFDKPVATVDTAHLPSLPAHSQALFAAKKSKQLSFEQIGQALGRDEVAVAAIFYGQAHASEEDVNKLSQVLGIDRAPLHDAMYGLPDRGRSVPMPPREPLIYRLYEIVQNYGYAYKAILNEKFGDGIMSAISFSTNVKKETDEKGDWVVITMRGKWLPYTRF